MTERRQLQRHSLCLPVTLEHGAGLTRDLSASGVYFETSDAMNVTEGTRLLLAIDLITLRDAGLSACCEAEVVRTELKFPLVGVAAKITSLSFDHFDRWLSFHESEDETSH